MQNYNEENAFLLYQESLIYRTQLKGTTQFVCTLWKEIPQKLFRRGNALPWWGWRQWIPGQIEQKSLNTAKAENCEQYPLCLLKIITRQLCWRLGFENQTRVVFLIITFEVQIWASKVSLPLFPSLLPFVTSGWVNTQILRFWGGIM